MNTSPYLSLPLRTIEQAKWERLEAFARRLDAQCRVAKEARGRAELSRADYNPDTMEDLGQ